MNASQFFGAMFRPLGRLTEFRGRSLRSEFWPFIFLLFAFQQVGAIFLMVSFFGKLEQIGRAQMEGAIDETAAEQIILGSLSGLVTPLLAISGIAGFGTLVLIAAAVTRRLHDTNRTGWWGLAPLPFLVAGLLLMWRAFDVFQAAEQIDAENAWFAILPLFLNNLVYLALVTAVLVFCAQDGTIGANRFGDDPKRRDPVNPQPSQPL